LAGASGTAAILLLVEKEEYAPAAALGMARALPAYSRKTTQSGPTLAKALVMGADPGASFMELGQEMASALRRAQALADAPAEEVNTSQVESAAIAAVGEVPGVTITSIVGEELLDAGLNAIYTVGRAGVDPPRMVVLEYTPSNPVGPPLGLVGKGIVFDSGGLNLKTSPSYMKGDMGGAAAVLGAFEAIVKSAEATGFSSHLYAVRRKLSFNQSKCFRRHVFPMIISIKNRTATDLPRQARDSLQRHY
jgi:probable aminopeptidase NPEPL1